MFSVDVKVTVFSRVPSVNNYDAVGQLNNFTINSFF